MSQVRRLVQASHKALLEIKIPIYPKKIVCPWRLEWKYLIGSSFWWMHVCNSYIMRLEIVDDDVRQHQRFGNVVAMPWGDSATYALHICGMLLRQSGWTSCKKVWRSRWSWITCMPWCFSDGWVLFAHCRRRPTARSWRTLAVMASQESKANDLSGYAMTLAYII